MGNTISKMHAKFHRASLIKNCSNGQHTQVSIRLYVQKTAKSYHEDAKTKKIGLKIIFSEFLKNPSWEILF